MSDQRTARPRQVTLAAGLAITGSLLLVVMLYEAMGASYTADTRESVAAFLATPLVSGLGLTVGQAIRIMRGLTLFNGALAAVGAVLGGYVLARHVGARIGLTIVAAVLVISATSTGGLLPFVIALGAAMLWTKPARDWFAGREPSRPTAEAFRIPPPPPKPTEKRTERPTTRPRELFGPSTESSTGARLAPPVDAPRAAARPFGSDPKAPDPSWPPPQLPGAVAHAQPPAAAARANPGRPPAAVTVAARLTWVFAGIAGFGFLLTVLLIMFSRDQLLAAIRRTPQLADSALSTNELLAVVWTVSSIAVVWSLASMVLAFFVLRRHNWARGALVVSAVLAALLSLLFAQSGLSLAWLAASVAAVVLLLASRSREWFRGRTGSPSGSHQPERKPPSNVW